MTPESLRDTSNFLRAAARHIVAEARASQEAVMAPTLDDSVIRSVIRDLYNQAKRLDDSRAAMMAPPPAPPTGGGTKTNVGDPTSHGVNPTPSKKGKRK